MKRILTGVALVALLVGVFAMPLHARGWNNPNREGLRQADQICWNVEGFDDCPRYNLELRCFGDNFRCSENNQRQNNNGNRGRNGVGLRR